MKTFGKYVTILFFLLTLLGAGFYLVLNNLGFMLSADHSGLQCRWITSGVEIRTGGRLERIQLKNPVQFRHDTGRWEIQSGNNIVIVKTIPRLKLMWKKVIAPPLKTKLKKSPI